VENFSPSMKEICQRSLGMYIHDRVARESNEKENYCCFLPITKIDEKKGVYLLEDSGIMTRINWLVPNARLKNLSTGYFLPLEELS
jgi:hypothetical protein